MVLQNNFTRITWQAIGSGVGFSFLVIFQAVTKINEKCLVQIFKKLYFRPGYLP